MLRLTGSKPARIDWELIRPLVPRAWHLVASALLGLVMYSSGLLFLRAITGPAPAGYHTAALTLVTFFINVGMMYGLTLLPSLTRLVGDRSRQLAVYETAFAYVFAASLPVAVGGTLLAPQIVSAIYGPPFASSALPLSVLIWILPVGVLRDVPLAALLSAGRERVVFRLTVVCAVIGVVLCAVLVPGFGLVGAAWATLLAEVARLGFMLFYARAHGFPLPSLRRFQRAVVAALAMAAGLVVLRPSSAWVGVPLGAAVFFVGLILAGGLRFGRGRWVELSV